MRGWLRVRKLIRRRSQAVHLTPGRSQNTVIPRAKIRAANRGQPNRDEEQSLRRRKIVLTERPLRRSTIYVETNHGRHRRRAPIVAGVVELPPESGVERCPEQRSRRWRKAWWRRGWGRAGGG